MERGSNEHLLAIESESEVAANAVAEQYRRFENQLVMSNQPRRSTEVSDESQSTRRCERLFEHVAAYRDAASARRAQAFSASKFSPSLAGSVISRA